MTPQLQLVPLQRLSPWFGAGDSILGAHLGTIAYLLRPQAGGGPRESPITYLRNEDVWRDVIKLRVSLDDEIVLDSFQVLDWFPRAPGLFHTWDAELARQEAYYHLDYRFAGSPIRDHARRQGEERAMRDYTVVFTPEGKFSMLQGGIGSIRLKPIRLFGEAHWFMTATSDGVAHTGFPLAVPKAWYKRLMPEIQSRGSACATVRGKLELVDDAFSRLFDVAVMIPRLYLRVTEVKLQESPRQNVEASVAVSFVSEYQGPANVYVTYVTFRPDVEGSFEEAVLWMKKEYVEGGYHGRIITDFDQIRTVFPEAKLALSSVMDRVVARGALRESAELMHVTASVEEYFDEIARRGLLPGRQHADRSKIFISYAHSMERETKWVSRIRKHLEGLARSSGTADIEVWDDTRIEPGQKWREQIEIAISCARVAVLVLTADFLASPFIQDAELPLLLEQADAAGTAVLCLYGSEVHLSGVAGRLQRYQFVNGPDEPLQALSEAGRESVYKRLAQAVEKAMEQP